MLAVSSLSGKELAARLREGLMFLPETTRCIDHVSQRAVSEAVTYCSPVGTPNAMPADQGIFCGEDGQWQSLILRKL